MNHLTFFTAGFSPALGYAIDDLVKRGCQVTETPSNSVTHLLLPVPTFDPDGFVKGKLDVREVLAQLPLNTVILGGNLEHPALCGYRCKDFLTDPLYLAENASITAHCALRLMLQQLPATVLEMPILVVGWGRIGKCLASLLKSLGADVTVAARKPTDRAMLWALGYRAADPALFSQDLARYRVILNTAPYPVIDKEKANFLRNDALKIDLASSPGILAENVIWARGLPGKDAPESSGELIARTAIRLALDEGVLL